MNKLSTNSHPKVIDDNEIREIESNFKIKLPDYFLSFLKQYGGTSTKEIVYTNSFWVNFFLPLKSDITLSIESIFLAYQSEYNQIEWLPFAIDSGGWPFCIALKEDIKGQVWVDKFDSGDENSFEFVANTFEEFINGLKTEEEAFS